MFCFCCELNKKIRYTNGDLIFYALLIHDQALIASFFQNGFFSMLNDNDINAF